MAHIEYYIGTTSPNVYMAALRLEELAAKHGATIAYKPIHLATVFARTGGLPPKERHPSRQAYRLQELRRNAIKAGLPINIHPAHWPTNPAPSSYAVIAAQAAGGGDLGGLVFGLSRAVWAEERDIAQDDVIADCLEAAGFDRGLVHSGLLTGAETYAANGEEAIAAGVFGAPFYIVGEEMFWGQDRLPDLDAHLAGKL